MKILLISVRSDFGGGPRHVDQLAKALPKGYDVYMAYPKEGDPYGTQWNATIPDSNRIYIPYRKFSLKALFDLHLFIKKNDIGIVHSHGNGAGIYSRLLKLVGCKAKIVHTFHGVTDSYSSKLKLYLNVAAGRFLKHFTDSFILVSKGEMNLAERMGFIAKKKAHVVFNGIATPDRIAQSSDFKIISLSRFDYQKNMDLAYEIADSLKDEDIEFVWVGNGDHWERLKKQSEQKKLRIHFVGFSDKPMDYLANSSVYLSTSRFEGLPYALIEAASVGLPIVATDVVGNNEVVVHERNGFLFKNADEACRYLKSLKNDESLRTKMAEESKTFFKENFTVDHMIKSLCRIYENC